jgi:hypothetical protein
METEYEAQICSAENGFPGVEKYYIRKTDPGYPWGIFYIDEGSGIFFAVTDYGSWSYSWTHHGCKNLKEFLVEILDKPYCIEKLSKGKREFDVHETQKKVLYDLFNARREEAFSKFEARRLYEDINGVFEDFGYSDGLSSFQTAAYHLFDFHRLYPDYDMPIREVLPQSLRAAQKDLFVPLKGLLKEVLGGD